MPASRDFVSLVLKIVLPLLTIGASAGVAYWLCITKPAPPQQEVEEAASAVAAARVEERSVCFPVRSQGTVLPRTETTLIARVPGQVVKVADCFDESGFFRAGDVLVEIDRRDHELRVRRLDASLRATQAQRREAQARLDRLRALRQRLAISQAEFEQAESAADAAVAREAELEAQLEEARNALDDTRVLAPFDGCVRQTRVDLGQYVTTGTPLATCFATDAVEVRLPIDDHDLAFLKLPLGVALEYGRGPEVILEAEFGGRARLWRGHVVRTEAIVDSRSRMVFLVAEVKAPYDDADRHGGQPLAVGMFVTATIRCPPVPRTVVLPEECVNDRGELFVIDEEGRLARRTVGVLRRDRQWIAVQGELDDGMQVCATRLEGAVPGMKVQVVEDISLELTAAAADGVVDLCDGVRLAQRSQSSGLLEE